MTGFVGWDLCSLDILVRDITSQRAISTVIHVAEQLPSRWCFLAMRRTCMFILQEGLLDMFVILGCVAI